MQDRRRSVRHEPSEELIGELRLSLPAKILDVSVHGIQLEVPQALQRRSEYRLSIPTPDGVAQVRAVVRRCTLANVRPPRQDESEALALAAGPQEPIPVYRAGLEFLDVSAEHEALLRRHYGDAPLSDETPQGVPAEKLQMLLGALEISGPTA
jgi:hypothetical protein